MNDHLIGQILSCQTVYENELEVTRNQIIENLFTGTNFNDCICKMEPQHLQQDLKMEVISIVCEWPGRKDNKPEQRRCT
jgi:hypothetical protein